MIPVENNNSVIDFTVVSLQSTLNDSIYHIIRFSKKIIEITNFGKSQNFKWPCSQFFLYVSSSTIHS